MCPPFVVSATSQTQVNNNQVVLSNVFADQTLDVVDVSDSTSAITPATANTFTGSVVGGSDADVQSTQDVQADVSASALVNVTGSSGDSTILSTAATGNSGEANIYDGGTLTGTSTQSVGAYNVTASGEYAGPSASTGGLSSSTQAVANSQGYGVEASNADVTVVQSSDALTQADDGGNLQYTDGTAIFSALGTSNNVTAVGTYGSAVTLDVTQTMTGTRTQASNFTGAGNAQDITAQATTTANNVNATNEGYLNVVTNQDNQSYVRAEANLTSYEYGAATASAYGVGNSTLAGAYGNELVLNNTQTNSGGGVEVIAQFTGNTGYDAYVSSTAIGNAVTGYVCSTCGGTMTVSNQQTNSAEVGAFGTAAINGSGRSVQSLTAATGNSATFYVSSPSE